jgi:hypothetical protein
MHIFRIFYHIKLYNTTLSVFSVAQALEICMTTMLVSLVLEDYGPKCSSVCSKLLVGDTNRHDILRFDLLRKQSHQVKRFHIQINIVHSTNYFHSQRVTDDNCKILLLKEMQAYVQKNSQGGNETKRK